MSISVIVSFFTEAIGRLHAGQSKRVTANYFNCSIRTTDRLQIRFNATNSTNDRPRSGRPQVTTPRQNRAIVRHHLMNALRQQLKLPEMSLEYTRDQLAVIQYNVDCLPEI